MKMQLTTSYQKLFDVKLLHHYWLDDGAVVYDQIADPIAKTQRLQDYDIRPFLSISPTAATSKKLAAVGAKFCTTAYGFSVFLAKNMKVALDSSWEWVVIVNDSSFFAYTAFGLLNQTIREFRHPLQNKIYRYKENVQLFSNTNGDIRGSQLFLSQPLPKLAADDRIESLIQAGNALKQLTSDQPGAQTQTLNASYRKLPVYAHQGDIPVISLPPGLNAPPLRGIELSEGIPDQVYALIRLQATRKDKPVFSLVDDNGLAKDVAPIFEVHLKNRSTLRRYIHKQTGNIISTENNPLPLTFFGNAGSGQKPLPTPPRIIKNGSRIVQLISDIAI
jgi:hypothetical protein